jgi:hypothetical protein
MSNEPAGISTIFIPIVLVIDFGGSGLGSGTTGAGEFSASRGGVGGIDAVSEAFCGSSGTVG